MDSNTRRNDRAMALRVAVVAGFALAFILAAGCGSSAPSADAGSDFSISVGQAPNFDGCGSSGDGLSYSWAIVGAPSDMTDDVGKVLRQAESECAFTLESEMVVADEGVWEIELTVSDGTDTSTDRVEVLVQ